MKGKLKKKCKAGRPHHIWVQSKFKRKLDYPSVFFLSSVAGCWWQQAERGSPDDSGSPGGTCRGILMLDGSSNLFSVFPVNPGVSSPVRCAKRTSEEDIREAIRQAPAASLCSNCCSPSLEVELSHRVGVTGHTFTGSYRRSWTPVKM